MYIEQLLLAGPNSGRAPFQTWDKEYSVQLVNGDHKHCPTSAETTRQGHLPFHQRVSTTQEAAAPSHRSRRTDPEQPPTPGEMETHGSAFKAGPLPAAEPSASSGRARQNQKSLVSRIRSRATRHTKNPEEGSRVLGRHVSPGCRQSTIAHTALAIKGPAGVRATTWTASGLSGTLVRRAGDEAGGASPHAPHVPTAVGGVVLERQSSSVQ